MESNVFEQIPAARTASVTDSPCVTMEATAGAPDPINSGDTLVVEEVNTPGLVGGAIYVFERSQRVVVGRVSWIDEWDGKKHYQLRIRTGSGDPINIVNIEDGQPSFWNVVGHVSHVIKPL